MGAVVLGEIVLMGKYSDSQRVGEIFPLQMTGIDNYVLNMFLCLMI